MQRIQRVSEGEVREDESARDTETDKEGARDKGREGTEKDEPARMMGSCTQRRKDGGIATKMPVRNTMG